jgi:mannose-1-phosphate guanylyltransferase
MQTNRPWGTYEILQEKREGENFLIKKIVVNPNSRLSLQSHAHRSEHWIVVQGSGKVTVGEDDVVCGINSQLFIPRGAKHRITNTSMENILVFVEVQVGDVLQEDDIVRYQDDYGRSGDTVS